MIRLAFLLTALAFTSGCKLLPHECTEIGCLDGFRLELARPSGWPAGAYEVDVTIDGARTRCEVDFPLLCDRAPRCTGADETRKTFQLGLSGCLLPASQHSLSDVTFVGTPARVDVTISQGTRVLGSGQYAPVYKTEQPNGPDCEPTCRIAPTMSLSLSP